MTSTQASVTYAALRQGGAPAGRARLELGLPDRTAVRLEKLFLNRRDELRPKFARHDMHVGAVMGQGGFQALPERRR